MRPLLVLAITFACAPDPELQESELGLLDASLESVLSDCESGDMVFEAWTNEPVDAVFATVYDGDEVFALAQLGLVEDNYWRIRTYMDLECDQVTVEFATRINSES